MASVTHPTKTERNKVFSKMTPSLKKVAKDIESKTTKEVKATFLANWDKGKHVETVLGDDVKYGQSAVAQLAAFIGTSETALYDLRTFCQTFTRAQVEKLSERQMNSGRRMSPGHLLAIMRVPTAADRKKLIEKTFDKSLTTNELGDEIAGAYDKRNKRSGGRKPKNPVSVAAGLQQINSRTQELNNRFPVWEESVFSQVDEAEPSRFTQAMLDNMVKAESQLAALEENVTSAHEHLRKNITRAKKVLANKGTSKASKKKVTKARRKITKAKASKGRTVTSIKRTNPKKSKSKAKTKGTSKKKTSKSKSKIRRPARAV